MKPLIYFLFLFFIPIAFAVNETTYTNVSIYPPQHYYVNYTQLTTNDTYNYDINCSQNATLESCEATKCDVTRTLNHGETYVKSDANCDLNLGCPVCTSCTTDNNVTHEIRWHLYTENNRIWIEYLNDNITRNYPLDEPFNYETEFEVQCPEIDEERAYRYDNILNVTDDQWYYVCGKSLESVMKSFSDSSVALTEWQRKLTTDYAVCTSSNVALGTENGELRQKVIDYDTVMNNKNNMEQELKGYREKYQTCEAQRNEKSAWEIIKNIVVILAFIIVFGWGLYRMFFWIAGIKPKEVR